MDQLIKGIIIHHLRYADNSFIVRIYCEHHGMKAFMVRSGKSAKSSKVGMLQALNLVEFESSIKENTQIHQLKNLRISYPFRQIPFDPVKSAMVMFLDEILYKTIPDDYANDQLYTFLSNAILLLDDAIDGRNFHLWCMLEISRHYGFYPHFEQKSQANYFDLSLGEFVATKPQHTLFMDSESTEKLYQMMDMEWPQVQNMNLHSQLRKYLLESLVKYIQLHLENVREIKSLSILHEVFH